VPEALPANAPRLRLHFTLPVLPSSVSADSFVIRRLPNLEVLQPRSVRVVTSRFDQFPGSTLEVDLGSLPRLRGGDASVRLRPGDWISVEVTAGEGAVTDYAGNTPLPTPPQGWTVVEGRSVALAEWPSGDRRLYADDPVLPSFEVRSGVIRPRVRVEAGDGSLGVFRPARDTTLRPGVPFDRGDGQLSISNGEVFPFLAVEIPEGVTVEIDATSGPVRILSCGDVRIDGTLRIAGDAFPVPLRRFETPVAELLADAHTALLAAGDVHVRGEITATAHPGAGESPLTIAAAGRMHLRGALPFQTVLAVEAAAAGPGEPAIVGTLGQTTVVAARFEYGLAPGAEFAVRGFTSWRQMPLDRDVGVIVVRDADPELRFAAQTAPAHPVRRDEPDDRFGRLGRPQTVRDRDSLAVEPGTFVRFEVSADLTAGGPLPSLRELRLEDR
jgi:hypothetical protein